MKPAAMAIRLPKMSKIPVGNDFAMIPGGLAMNRRKPWLHGGNGSVESGATICRAC